jgi:hypothetical protein
MSNFISNTFYNYEYFEKRYPKFGPAVIQLITDLSKEKLILQPALKRSNNEKNAPIDVKITRVETIIHFD